MFRICVKCKQKKQITEFRKNEKMKSGFRSSCKKCDYEYCKKYHQEHRKEIKKTEKKYREEHKEQSKKYREKNSERLNEYNKEYRKKNKEKCKNRYRKYQIEHKEELKKQRRRPEIKAIRNKQQKDRRKTNIQIRLNGNIRSAIRKALRGNKAGRHWETLVGYTIKDLMQHLERLFEPWMNWSNYGEWHVDHKTPASWFNYKTIEDKEFKECWALENLQPLEAKENFRKNNKYKS